MATTAKAAIVTKDRSLQTNPIHYPFWFGGSASCFAACVTHPLDLIKVRLQTQSHGAPRLNMAQMFVHVLKYDGVLGLYKGLSASIMRQLTYSTVRFGAYEKLKESVTASNPTPSVFTLVGIACASGVAGGIAGNPADLLNVRMQNDASLPVEKRRNYKNAVDGIIRMAREEGPKSLFRGVGPNSIRAALMTASQLATYDTFKGLLLARTPMQDNLTTHFTASLLAGLVATTVCSPFDVIKTRIMSSHEQHGIVQLITNTFKNEGFSWMFRGWVPSFMRLGPHTIFTFIFLEQHKSLYRKFIGADDA